MMRWALAPMVFGGLLIDLTRQRLGLTSALLTLMLIAELASKR